MSKEYNGDPIDASWQTAPWNNDGETIDAHDSEGDGEIMTIDWPENATPKEELNDNQQQLIKTAARYPKVNSRCKLLELSGLNLSEHYPNYVLREHWPERYWNEPDGGNTDKSKPKETQQEKSAKNNPDEVRQRLLNGESVNQLIKEYYECSSEISRIARGDGTDCNNCEIPPLCWNETNQEWERASEYDVSSLSTQKLREEALNGETAVALADKYGVSEKTIRYRLNGKGAHSDNCETPPLEHTHDDGWQIPDENAQGEENTETHSVTPDPVRHTPEPDSSSLPAWVWAVVGAAFAWIVSKILG